MQITIKLPDALYQELLSASTDARELGFKPETWAQEAVEAALAARRLERMSPVTAEDIYRRKQRGDLERLEDCET